MMVWNDDGDSVNFIEILRLFGTLNNKMYPHLNCQEKDDLTIE